MGVALKGRTGQSDRVQEIQGGFDVRVGVPLCSTIEILFTVVLLPYVLSCSYQRDILASLAS